jgi:hypothetical protein
MHLIDHGGEWFRIDIARVGQRIGNDIAHAARMRRDNDNACGDEDRLGDVVRHEEDALQAAVPGAAPQVDHFAAQALRGEDIECAEWFVHAQYFRLRDKRPREADALAHAA